MSYIIYCDGSVNPRSKYTSIYDPQLDIKEVKEYSTGTNNDMEYLAVIMAIEYAERKTYYILVY